MLERSAARQSLQRKPVITSVKTVVSARDEYDTFIALAHEDALEFVVSNTTEAGIVCDANDKFEDCPPTTFPAKLTKFLYERYTFYKGASDKGLCHAADGIER